MDKLSIPNSFYDLIVFLVPTLGGVAMLAFGLRGTFDWGRIFDTLSLASVVLLAVLIAVVAYEYGRALEAWSATFVQKPIFLLQEWFGWPRNGEFGYAPNANGLGLPETLPDEIAKNRWTFYYVAAHVDREIGSDLLKRYAWEKLSRSAALNYLIMSIVGGVCFAIRHIRGDTLFDDIVFEIGSVEFALTSLSLYVITSAEYYRRANWNLDLLRKISPVLSLAIGAKSHSNITVKREQENDHD